MKLIDRNWWKTPAGRRFLATALGVLSGVLLVGAGAVAAYPLYTDLRANNQQDDLSVEFDTEALKDAYAAKSLQDGDPLTRLQIEKLGVDFVVVEGTSPKALATGAGHYPETPLPGEQGNVAIAGHRNLHGKVFADLDDLRPGDQVVLTTPFARHIYEVTGAPWVTAPNDWSVIDQTDGAVLTLTTCHPYGTNEKRLVVRAELILTEELA